MNQRGFTLLELLIAIVMLAVIIGLMGGSLTMAYRSGEKGQKKIDALERKRIIYTLLESQIQSAFYSAYSDQGEIRNRFVGTEEGVTFASHYSIWQGVRGNCLVSYHVETDDRQKCVLKIEERMMGTDVVRETVVETDYDSIRFEYFIEDVLEDESKWVERWPEDRDGMPQKIKIHFAEGPKDRIMTMRVFTQMSSSPSGVTSNPVVTK